MSRKLTFEEIQSAFAQTGLTPKPGITYNGVCACPISAVYATGLRPVQNPERYNTLARGRIRQMMKDLDLDGRFAEGLIFGFDGREAPGWFFDIPACQEGYTLGVRCREELC